MGYNSVADNTSLSLFV